MDTTDRDIESVSDSMDRIARTERIVTVALLLFLFAFLASAVWAFEVL